ncbi:hypothetical protein EDD94_7685 [Streptomyces sp. PanSC9]|nr:hypothetical protein EDD94_7685 [Streptomyces sp. PanSC9]
MVAMTAGGQVKRPVRVVGVAAFDVHEAEKAPAFLFDAVCTPRDLQFARGQVRPRGPEGTCAARQPYLGWEVEVCDTAWNVTKQ